MTKTVFKAGTNFKILAVALAGAFLVVIVLTMPQPIPQFKSSFVSWLVIVAVGMWFVLVTVNDAFVRCSVFEDSAFRHRTIFRKAVRSTYQDIRSVHYNKGRRLIIYLKDGRAVRVNAYQGDLDNLHEYLIGKVEKTHR